MNPLVASPGNILILCYLSDFPWLPAESVLPAVSFTPLPPLQCSTLSLHFSPFIHNLTPFLVVTIQHPTLPYPLSPGGSP